ncbi:hypothetical protein O979_16380 [Mycobacterium avium subsp. paratuberculosis 10-4404]|nr:hypothetical protein O979_16380 [Mycobacterium avium subsp. paratuberculosis 10-4404]ETB02267.1 hypothetical protein O978_16275 [Mycobacterium avium subsp. paratuberculosis 10-5864]ETB10331.1 hypothetical protein O980_15925 [Mycobacterium avium subsp. paratuberculosis 08-8281]ETB37364.1 hypothetical protein O975_17435 [Mycobacterium avium subsp. paratuberculosis 11-1786]ETB49322.1 hypothetical protein O976_16820 [Mycobacterium avium subsp. paratuberculosis 10-8425]
MFLPARFSAQKELPKYRYAPRAGKDSVGVVREVCLP